MDREEGLEESQLMGEHLHLFMRQQNHQRQREIAAKRAEYASLSTTLDGLVQRSRISLLAPVAGGLAYLPARLVNTNQLVVLLGDGWFVERSAAQAKDIVQRRLQYLDAQGEELRGELKSLEEKITLMGDELREGGASSTATTHGGDPAAADSASNTKSDPNAFGTLSVGELRMLSRLSNLPIEDLTTIGPEDELTEGELMEVEERLMHQEAEGNGSSEREMMARVDDDDFIERLLTEAVIRKKEKKLREKLADLLRREEMKGTGCQPASPEEQPQRKDAKEKKVTWAPTTAAVEGNSSNSNSNRTHHYNPNLNSSAALNSSPSRFGDEYEAAMKGAGAVVERPQPAAPARPPPPSIVIGEVVEREDPLPPDPNALPGQPPPSKMSLYRRAR